MRLSFYRISTIQERLVYKVQTEVTPSTTNLYGPVSSGTIRLTGTLIPASVEPGLGLLFAARLPTLRYDISRINCWMDTPLVQMNVRLIDGTGERTTRRAKKEEESSGGPYPVTLLPILNRYDGVAGLILGRSATCIGAYERVGVFLGLSREVFGSMRKDYLVTNITLV